MLKNNNIWQKISHGTRRCLDSAVGMVNVKGYITDLHEKQMSRLEMLRNEILFEMKYGRTDEQSIKTRIINEEKFERMMKQNELVLNIGAGHKCIPDMINVDRRELPNIDVLADAADVRVPHGIAKGIYSAHVLEHFTHERLRRSVLPGWVALLREGGFFRAIVPDAEGMIDAYVNGRMSFKDLRTVTFGLQEYEGDIHYTMFSRDSLRLLLEEAGLHDVKYIATSRANGLCLEMEVIANK